MKKIITLLLATVFSLSLSAKQVSETITYSNLKSTADTSKKSNWKFTGVVGLNASQLALWNWASGGNNNVNGRLFTNLTLGYKKGKFSWDSNFDTEIGFMYMENTSYPKRKTSDKINFSTKGGFEFSKNWYLTILGDFKSQYLKGYDYKTTDGIDTMIYTSKWLAPSYTDISIGVDWKPNTIFTAYLSPLTGRITTATDSLLRSKYGVPIGQTYNANLGASLKLGVNYSPVKELKIISTLTMFTPYTSKEQAFGNIDVDWDISISYQFLKVLNVSLGTSLKYYDQIMITDKKGNVGPRVQFKEVIGVGIGYSF